MTTTTAIELPQPAHRIRRVGTELALLVGLYSIYGAGRAVIGVQVSKAYARGTDILHVETLLHLDVEGPLNRLVMAVPAVALAFCYAYATLHYVVTPMVLGWVAWRHRDGYRRARAAMVVMTLSGLVVYALLPTAPPRLLGDGLVDAMAHFAGSGWWGDAASAPKGLEGLSNQYAAMPSLHVGWAVWCALCLRRHAGSQLVRRLAPAYPALVALVVIATANHYLLDAVAGALFAGLGWWAATALEQFKDSRNKDDHHQEGDADPDTTDVPPDPVQSPTRSAISRRARTPPAGC
jgi:hypothetical protein